MTLVIVILAVISFVVILTLLYNVCIRKYKSSEPKKLTTAPKEDKKAENNEDKIPDILQEVTLGNYMQDRVNIDESDQLEANMVENNKIRRVGYEFKPIEIEGEMQDEALSTKDILDELDGNIGAENELNKEISSLSPTMKAMLIANLLEKKNKF